MSDEDLIISIPDDEPEDVQDAEFKIVDPDDDTPIEETPEVTTESTSEGPAALSWSAIKLYHPLLGANGSPEDVPEHHKFSIAANMMLGPVGAPLREGGSNIFITGTTPEDVAQEFYNTIIEVFRQMQEHLSPIKKPTMAEMARLKAEMEARNRGR